MKLSTLRAKSSAFLASWKAAGGKIVQWRCPHCHKQIDARQPAKDDVGNKGYWDSCTTCVKCGKLSFVRVWPSGKTEVIKM